MQKHQEWISLESTGSYEDDPDGGYFTIYKITGFGMGKETACLTYDTRGPTFPSNTNPNLVASMAKETRRGPVLHSIFKLDTINDDVVEELRERGVEIIFEKTPAVE